MTYLGMIEPYQWIIILITLFLWIIPAIIALIDILKNEFNDNDKIVWVLVVLFTGLLGAICYFAIGRKQKTD